MLHFNHKKCAKSHKQSQFYSKFIPTFDHDIFKQSNLIGHMEVKFNGIFRDRFVEIFGANFAEKLSVKTANYVGWSFAILTTRHSRHEPMAKLLTTWLVHSFRLVVMGCCSLIVVMQFQNKFASLPQLNSPIAEISFKYVVLTCIW